jgi:hypothetical protein
VAQHQVEEVRLANDHRRSRHAGRRKRHGGIASGRESGLVSGHVA